MTAAFPATERTAGSTPGKVVILVAWGAVLWFLAAMIVRALAPTGALDGGVATLMAFAATVPATIPFVLIGRRLAGLAKSKIVEGVAIVTATATFLDAVAMIWFQPLYSRDPAQALHGAAFILWGVGVGLSLALAMNRVEPR